MVLFEMHWEATEFKERSDTYWYAFLTVHTGHLEGNNNWSRETISQTSRWTRNYMGAIRLYFGDEIDDPCWWFQWRSGWEERETERHKGFSLMGHQCYSPRQERLNGRGTGF